MSAFMALPQRWLARPDVGLAACALAGCALVAFGIIGIGRDSVLNADMQFLFVAGRMWAHGHSPYVLPEYRHVVDGIAGLKTAHVRMGFAYPPTISLLCLVLGAMSLGAANVTMVLLNLAAAMATAHFAYRLVAQSATGRRMRESLRWATPALVFIAPFTAHIVYCGQTTLLATAAVLAGWCYLEEERPWLAGALLAVASIKPQIALLPVAYGLLQRGWRPVASFACAGALLITVPVSASGLWGLVREWLQSLHDYASGPIQAIGFQNVFGIQSLLVASGVEAPSIAWVAFAVLVALWWRRDRTSPDEVLSVLLASTCLFVYAHDYDLAALAPLFALVWRLSATSNTRSVFGLAFYVLLFAPQRYVRSSRVAVIIHWRELVLLAALVALLVSIFRRSPREAPIASLPAGA
jgi:hypothetical protein